MPRRNGFHVAWRRASCNIGSARSIAITRAFGQRLRIAIAPRPGPLPRSSTHPGTRLPYLAGQNSSDSSIRASTSRCSAEAAS